MSCHSKLNMLGSIPGGQLDCFKLTELFQSKMPLAYLTLGKRNQAEPKQFQLTLSCLRLIQGGAPQVSLLAYKPHQLQLYN